MKNENVKITLKLEEGDAFCALPEFFDKVAKAAYPYAVTEHVRYNPNKMHCSPDVQEAIYSWYEEQGNDDMAIGMMWLNCGPVADIKDCENTVVIESGFMQEAEDLSANDKFMDRVRLISDMMTKLIDELDGKNDDADEAISDDQSAAKEILEDFVRQVEQAEKDYGEITVSVSADVDFIHDSGRYDSTEFDLAPDEIHSVDALFDLWIAFCEDNAEDDFSIDSVTGVELVPYSEE